MHQNYLRPTPGSDSPGNQVRVVGLPPHQQQQQQPPLNQLQGADLGWLARADEQSGSSWFVGTGGDMNRISPLFSPYPSWALGPAKGFAPERLMSRIRSILLPHRAISPNRRRSSRQFQREGGRKGAQWYRVCEKQQHWPIRSASRRRGQREAFKPL